MSWEDGEEDLVEWNERKGDVLYQMVEFYEEGVVKLKHRLQELIETSDTPLTVNINWGGLRILGPPFQRILSDVVCPFWGCVDW